MRVPGVIALISLSLFLSGLVLLVAALLGAEPGGAEVALAAFFLSALVLVLPAVREVSVGTGGITLRLTKAEKKIETTRHAQLLNQAVWAEGSYWFLTSRGRLRLPDRQTADFLGAAGQALTDVEEEELDTFPTITSLESVKDALFVKRKDTGDHFFVFRGDDGTEYKAHIGSMSVPIDLRPSLIVPAERELTAEQLATYTTLR
jgi:hypothetical protein